MSLHLLNALQQLLGQHHQLPTNNKPMQRIAPMQHKGSAMNILLNRHPEDASFVGGGENGQGYYQQNADVAHFPTQPHGQPEDAGLVNGPQGYHPLSADVAHFNSMPQPQVRPLSVLPQGGQFNPGRIQLQGSNIRYRQGPQPTQSWYDF